MTSLISMIMSQNHGQNCRLSRSKRHSKALSQLLQICFTSLSMVKFEKMDIFEGVKLTKIDIFAYLNLAKFEKWTILKV